MSDEAGCYAHATARATEAPLTEPAKPWPPLDALVFDVGGVIVGHDNRRVYARLAARCAAPDVEAAAVAVEAAIRDPRWETGDAPVAALHAQLRDGLGYRGDWAAFLDDWTCHFTLDDAMVALLRRLAAQARVVLFSNTNREHWTHLLARYPGALDPFERYLSYEIGLAKPAVAAFAHVAAAAGIAPARSFFFDDRLENVEGARRAGFNAEVFTDRAALCAQLAAAGLLLPASG